MRVLSVLIGVVDAFLNLVLGTDFNTDETAVLQGMGAFLYQTCAVLNTGSDYRCLVMWNEGCQCDCDECGGWARGDDGGHHYTSETDSNNSPTQTTMRSNCALLSIVFSDVLIFHITNNDYLHSIRFVIPIFKLAIHFSSKEAPGRYVANSVCGLYSRNPGY